MATKLVLQVTGPGGVPKGRAEGDPAGVLVGSGPAAALRLDDPGVSALHCLVKLDRGRITVIDLGTEGGTRVGGAAIAGPTALAAGDVVELGESRLQVSLDAPESEPEGPAEAVAAANARERRGDEAPVPGGAPTPARRLEVAMYWGEVLLDVRHYDSGPATAGEGAHNDFQIFGAGEGLALARRARGGWTLSPPRGARVQLLRGGSEGGREELGGGAAPEGAIALQESDRARVELGSLSLRLRFVPLHPLPRRGLRGADRAFLTFVAIAAVIWATAAALFVLLATKGPRLVHRPDEFFQNPQRYAKLVLRPPQKRAATPSAKLKEKGKPEEAKEPSRAPEKAVQRGSSPIADEHRRRAMGAGLLAYLGGGTGSTSSVFSPGGLGSGIRDALGSLKQGGGVGESQAIAGLGTRGTGPGGGGGLGLGGLGTRGGGGRGSGGGGGEFGMNLGAAHARSETRVVPGKTTVSGSCERAVVGKAVARHASEVRYCYEVELNRQPSLAGKVSVSFTIDPAGAVSDATVLQSTLGSPGVEQCILARVRRWKFPEPKGGGVCVINYPWVFKAAGGVEDEGSGE
jgi:TonB family protein